MPVVTVTDSGYLARRGYPLELNATFVPMPEWDAKLKAFCDALSIDTSEAKGPGWFLYSYWG